MGKAPPTQAFVRRLSKRMLLSQDAAQEIVFTKEDAPNIKKAVRMTANEYTPPTKF